MVSEYLHVKNDHFCKNFAPVALFFDKNIKVSATILKKNNIIIYQIRLALATCIVETTNFEP
jgi:hypothetical protein